MSTPPKQQLTVVQQAYQGPIPSPGALAEYEKIHAGLADRIMQMAEKQQEHRQRLETLAVTTETNRAMRGQWFALIVALGGLALSGVCAFLNQQAAAAIIGATDITGLAGVFIYGHMKKREELAKRTQTPSVPTGQPQG